MSGLLLDRLAQWIRRLSGRRKTLDEGPTGSRYGGPALEAALFVGGALCLVGINVHSLRAMGLDTLSLQEFANDDYATAYCVAVASTRGQSVLISKPDTQGRPWELRDMQWVFASKRLKARVSGRLPADESIAAGTLVVVGVRAGALLPPAVEELRALGVRTGSLSSFRQYRNAAGNLSAASLCVRCGTSDRLTDPLALTREDSAPKP